MTPKVFTGFLVVTLLLSAVVEVKVACPNCGGIGHVNPMPGLENLQILNANARPIGEPIIMGGCTALYGYILGVNLSAANSGSNPMQARIVIIAKVPESDQIAAGKIIDVELPAHRTAYVWTFLMIYTKEYPKSTYSIVAYILGSERQPCIVCGGKGSISVIRWLCHLAKPSSPPADVSTYILPELAPWEEERALGD